MERTARRYRVRPSTLLQLTDPYEALDLDCAFTAWAEALEADAIEGAAQGEHTGPWGVLLTLLGFRL